MKKTLPPKLYKYQPYSVQTLDNLKNRRLWFSSPAKFNDPFDCARGFRISNLSNKDLEELYSYIGGKTPSKLLLEKKYMENGKPNKRFEEEITSGAQKSIEKIVNENREKRGVACFSEEVNNVLMWGHYADGHRGFCLEFDTTYPPFNLHEKVFKVEYSDELPEINPIEVLLNKLPDSVDTIMMMMRTKSKSWSYEKEWRFFHAEGDKEYGYGVDVLTGLYFGAEMPFVHKEIISLILAGSPTKLYEMQKVDGEFKVAFRTVEYAPYTYKKS